MIFFISLFASSFFQMTNERKNALRFPVPGEHCSLLRYFLMQLSILLFFLFQLDSQLL